MASLRLFVLEDDEIDIVSWQRFLKQHYPEDLMVSCMSVDQALNEFKITDFDVALLDWNLPDGEGVELAEHIRRFSATFPIVFLSALVTDKTLSQAAHYQPLGCVQKNGTSESMDEVMNLLKNSLAI